MRGLAGDRIEVRCNVVHVNGRPVARASARVAPADTIEIDLPERRPRSAPVAEPIPLSVVYEDGQLLIVNKPSGLVVHPAPGHWQGTLVNALLAHCGRLSRIGEPKRPGVVHRLDKDTSGLMIAAKTDHAHIALARQFAEHSIERAYYAVVWGVPSPERGRVAGNIGRDPYHRTRMAVVPHGGKSAATDYRLLEVVAGGAASLIECRPMTGRTHQIRVHMAMIGHPLVGDAAYSGRQRAGRSSSAAAAFASFRRQALHAFLIGFDHPETNARHRIEINLPSDIRRLIACSKSA